MMDLENASRSVWAFAEREHRDLVRGINRIHDVATELEEWITPTLSSEVMAVLGWVSRELEPHASWEEVWLYPEIDAIAGTPWATRAARFEHQQIRDMAAQVRKDEQLLHLGDPRRRLSDLGCHLIALETLLRSHIEREERFIIPLLADDRFREPMAPVGEAPAG